MGRIIAVLGKTFFLHVLHAGECFIIRRSGQIFLKVTAMQVCIFRKDRRGR
jgi:hypothetical protein